MKPFFHRARGRRTHTPGTMNKLETKYANQLEAWRLSGEILWWKFEPMKLNLAKATTYSPDFLVMRANCEIELHEAKGYWEDDARVKIKVAAEMFPLFKFVAVKWVKGEWKVEEFA